MLPGICVAGARRAENMWAGVPLDHSQGGQKARAPQWGQTQSSGQKRKNGPYGRQTNTLHGFCSLPMGRLASSPVSSVAGPRVQALSRPQDREPCGAEYRSALFETKIKRLRQ